MGQSVDRTTFPASDYDQFLGKVRTDLEALRVLLQRNGFGEGDPSIGAEVEFYIIDKAGLVCPINTPISQQLQDPQLTVELNRFNLEYNLTPQPFTGSPFLRSEQELHTAINTINQAAHPLGGQLVSIGILPTLRRRDFNPDMMTDRPRYHILANALREMRGGPFDIHIQGQDKLDLAMNDVTLEGANTSYQLHWRVPASEFTDYYNAVQLVTPLAIALGANSPSLFQKSLWQETRIALFSQSIDSRAPHLPPWRYLPRVYFGHGWLHHAWEAFAAAAALYPPLIPVLDEEHPHQVIADGGIPQLGSLKLHQGTTWPWNRAIYDHTCGGHLRIEMRALPAGPTPIDMSANGLLLIGCALALLNDMDRIVSVMPFHFAEHNFYRAAKHGLNANLIWPGNSYYELQDKPVTEILQTLLPLAEQALADTALDSAEIQRLMGVLRGRQESRINGSEWQRQTVTHLRQRLTKREAYHRMLEYYIQHSTRGTPVHEWSLPGD